MFPIASKRYELVLKEMNNLNSFLQNPVKECFIILKFMVVSKSNCCLLSNSASNFKKAGKT